MRRMGAKPPVPSKIARVGEGVCRKADLGGVRVLPHPIRMQSARREMQFLTSPSAGLRNVLASRRMVA
jgi:hypothetical protein